MIHRRAAVAVLALAACGKDTKEPAAVEPKIAEVSAPAPGAPALAKPDKPPAPAAPVGQLALPL